MLYGEKKGSQVMHPRGTRVLKGKCEPLEAAECHKVFQLNRPSRAFSVKRRDRLNQTLWIGLQKRQHNVIN